MCVQEGQQKLSLFPFNQYYPLPTLHPPPLSGRVRTTFPKIPSHGRESWELVPVPGRGRPRAPPPCSYLADILVGGEHPLQGDKHLADGHGSSTGTKIRASWDRAQNRRAGHALSVTFSAEKGPSWPPSHKLVRLAASLKRLRHEGAGCCCCCCCREPKRAGSLFSLIGCFAAVLA